MRAFLIAGTHSGCGKTTITLGLLAALRKKGLTVQPFKAGPDFIDSGLHRMAAGRTSRNLDLWMCGEAYVKDCFSRHGSDADIAVCEGVMGLYDGTPSTDSLARGLGIPVVLVVDAFGMAESAGPLVRGFRDWAPGPPAVKAVIFNRVASQRHFERLCRSVKDVAVLGFLPPDPRFQIPHRHLGLFVAEEEPMAAVNMDGLAAAVLDHIDTGRLLDLAAPVDPPPIRAAGAARTGKPVKVAVAMDRAFCFYYEDNIDLLREAGAQVVFFSPLADATLPEGIDAVYIGGGYPELYGETLAANVSMGKAIREWADAGGPLYAECGGFMYLCRAIRDFEDRPFEAAHVFPFEAVMERRRAGLGYREVLLRETSILGPAGERLRGHEFRYSAIRRDGASGREAPRRVYAVKNGSGEELEDEGYRYKNTLGSYIHIHFGSNRGLARHFLAAVQKGRTL